MKMSIAKQQLQFLDANFKNFIQDHLEGTNSFNEEKVNEIKQTHARGFDEGYQHHDHGQQCQ